MASHARINRRSFATVLVLWTVAVASMVLVTLQASAWRQAAAGREAVARIRAKWAARAGVEAAIAVLAADTLNPDTSNAYSTASDLAHVSAGDLMLASYAVWHSDQGGDLDGPADAHAKLNINLLTRDDLLTFLDMTEDVADSILDWIDADDDTRELGAEASYYLKSKGFRYQPRNAPMRSIQELELVAGVDARLVRGEDWNLNGILDPNEDDGDLSWPPDNADGKLDAGWSAYFTAASVDGGLSPTGLARLDLREAPENDIQQRLGLDRDQTKAVIAYAAVPAAKLEDFLLTSLANLARASGAGSPATQAAPLSRDQLADMFAQATLRDSTAGPPAGGKLNLNTAPAETLEHLAGIDPAIADSIILERESRPQGFTSITDLLDIPSISRQRLAALARLLDVRSNVYIVTCRGRDAGTGMEVEMVATLDRSALPITLKDLIVR
jgi:type II secretory pathway component PulK